MQIISGVVSGISRLSRVDVELSKDASRRLKWFDYYNWHAYNARLTCRYFGISPQTFYRWKKRYKPHNLKSLESHSCRPKRVRQPTYSPDLVVRVQQLREEYPRWGKDKIKVLLVKQGIHISVSMVGRILLYLKIRGVIREPVINSISSRKHSRVRPYAIRKPKEYQAEQPGDIVEVDTLDVRPLPGILLKHFTAYDVVSRWNVLGVSNQATAATAAHFLDDLEIRMPYKVNAIQVDGGSEFEAAFEQECYSRGIKLFVLPPRSPKLNGGVERANRIHTEEFYEVTDSSFELADIRTKLLQWEHICNTYRPNQALDYLTPLEYLQKRKTRKEVMYH